MTPQPVTLWNPLMRPSESDANFARNINELNTKETQK